MKQDKDNLCFIGYGRMGKIAARLFLPEFRVAVISGRGIRKKESTKNWIRAFSGSKPIHASDGGHENTESRRRETGNRTNE